MAAKRFRTEPKAALLYFQEVLYTILKTSRSAWGVDITLSCLWPASTTRWPNLCKTMIEAVMIACRADVATIQHEPVVYIFPILLRHQALEVVRNFREVGVVGEVEALRESLHVRIGRNAIPDFVEFAENDIGCLIRNTWQRN